MRSGFFLADILGNKEMLTLKITKLQRFTKAEGKEIPRFVYVQI